MFRCYARRRHDPTGRDHRRTPPCASRGPGLNVDPRTARLRSALESRFGLALEAVTDLELARAWTEAAPSADETLDTGLLERVIDRLPIDESSLFRNPQLWAWLEARALPGLVDRATEGGNPVQIASLGCAGGQEVFSLAMMMLSLFRSRGVSSAAAQQLVQIKGIDASASRVAAARSGVVSSWSVERAQQSWVSGLIAPDAERPGEFRVEPAALSLCQFEQGNLIELIKQPDAFKRFDLVLCQHVLIYFREEAAMEFLASLAGALTIGALLVVSPVESHLFGHVPSLTPLDWVGAAVKLDGKPAATISTPSPKPLARRRVAPPYQPVFAPAPHVSRHGSPTALESYLREANRQLANRRFDLALEAARAACFAEPDHLMARFVLGQTLMSVDPIVGKRVLLGLLDTLSELAPDAAVAAAEVTVEQLARAAHLLMSSQGPDR